MATDHGNNKQTAAGRLWRAAGEVVILAIAACVVLLSLGISEDPERHAAIAFLQYLPYPVYLLPAVVGFIWSFWLRWPWRLLAAATVGLVLVVLMGLAVGSPDEGHGHVRMMTYNIKANHAMERPNGVAELTAEILSQDPDILVMQDAGELHGVKDRTPQAFAALIGQRDYYMFGQYIVASRLPMRECAPGQIPFRGLMHTYVHCVVTAHGKDIDLVTVHFLTPRDGLNAIRHEGVEGLAAWRINMRDRLMQSQGLMRAVAGMKRARIVAGDLNAPERSTVVQNLLSTGLRDAYSSAAFGYGFTHGHSLKPHISFLRIDHILISDDIGVVKAYAGGAKGSEHRPVIADLRVYRDREE